MTESPALERHPIPTRRRSWTQKVRVGSQTMFLTCGEYDDGTLGEVFIDCTKTGSAMRAVLSTVAMFLSVGLQYGVPLEEYVSILTDMRFEPSGVVEGSAEITRAESILDFVGQHLKTVYLNKEEAPR